MSQTYSVKVNGLDLNLIGGLQSVYNYKFTQMAEQEMRMFKVARANRSILTNKEYKSKDLALYFEVCSTDRAGTELILSVMQGMFEIPNISIQAEQAGRDVKYENCNLKEFNITWYGPTADVESVFTSTDPFGEGLETESVVVPSITVAQTTELVQIFSPHFIEPIIDVTVTAISGGTSKIMTIKNGKTQQGITISRTFTAGDSIQIDSKNKQLWVNGALHDFTGTFPVYTPSLGNIFVPQEQLVYSDTFTTRTVDIIVSYNLKI